MAIERKMPRQVSLGRHMQATMMQPMMRYEDWIKDGKPNQHGLRTVMGYYLPKWQRGFVWTNEQKIKFIESAWLGLNLGTYTFNRADIGSEYDDLLIDGQQRMSAIQSYIEDEFKVFGYYYSEITEVDKRMWGISTFFACFITETQDEEYLRNYYNLMNFGGTAHKDDERA